MKTESNDCWIHPERKEQVKRRMDNQACKTECSNNTNTSGDFKAHQEVCSSLQSGRGKPSRDGKINSAVINTLKRCPFGIGAY